MQSEIEEIGKKTRRVVDSQYIAVRKLIDIPVLIRPLWRNRTFLTMPIAASLSPGLLSVKRRRTENR